MLTTLEAIRLLKWVGRDRRRLAMILQRQRIIRSIVLNDLRRKG
ncbi:hypothetical protein LCGC14_2754390, partial [marine sediment metagenome]